MSHLTVHFETSPRRPREATATPFFLFGFAPSAPGSQPISGRYILCNPNPFYPPYPLPSLVLAVLGLIRDIMSPKSGRPLSSLRPQDPASTAFLGPLFRPRSRFSFPEPKPLSSFTFRNFTHQHFFAIMVGLALSHSLKFDGYNRQRQTIRKNGTQNYRPFKWRLGYRTYIPNFFSPFFRGKDWAFFYEKSRGPSGG